MKRYLLASAIVTAGFLSVPCQGAYVSDYVGLNLREAPTEDGKVIEVLGYGTELDVIETSGDWSEVKVDGKVGYVCNQYVQEEDPLADMEYLGEWLTTAYTWTGCQCADGSWPEEGYSVACNSLELGTKVLVEGHGILVVTDRGPSNMPDEWLDLYMSDINKCITHGEKMLDVWVVSSP